MRIKMVSEGEIGLLITMLDTREMQEMRPNLGCNPRANRWPCIVSGTL